MSSFGSGDRATILIHFYRAMVGRADIWRMRMDATTNWAIGTTAGVVSFSLGNASIPHYVVLLASFLTGCFLMLEARRLTFYHLWQQRVLRMEEGMIRPALLAASADDAFGLDAAMVEALDAELGQTIPTMPLVKASARRLRRVYLYLFAAQWLAWILKLSTQPTPAASAGEVIARAGIGGVPGSVCVALSTAMIAAAGFMAFRFGRRDSDA